jgi:23S rRNA pseudouridine955/2504/2580 synthase
MSVTLRTVSEDEADIRLDRWFRRHFPGLTQGAIQKLLRTGQIRIDGKRAEAATRLLPGQSVRIPPMQAADSAEDRPAPEVDPLLVEEMAKLILYQDPQVVVLNKPFGLPSQGGPGIRRHLDQMLDGLRFGSPERPRLVHRLDKDTTGVIVVARTPGVAAKLAASFRTRAVEKTYWCVVVGRPVHNEGRIDVNLIRVEGFRGERAAVATEHDADVARAITDYTVVDHAGRKLSWLEMHPLTGRTHQLRVSCAAIGCPILGDAPYGKESEEGANSALVEGFADKLHLHARRIVFPHPAGGTLEVEAPLPPHMAQSFRDLGFATPAAKPPRRVT